jgi:hypothetical protein
MRELSKRRGLLPPAKIITTFQAGHRHEEEYATSDISIPNKERSNNKDDTKTEDEIYMNNFYLTEFELLETKKERLERWKTFFSEGDGETCKRRLINRGEDENASEKLYHKLLRIHYHVIVTCRERGRGESCKLELGGEGLERNSTSRTRLFIRV